MKTRISRIPFPAELVSVQDGYEVEVRGVNLGDLVALLNAHAPAMMRVWDQVKDEQVEFTTDFVKRVVRDLAVEFPDMLAAVIALVTDEYTDEGLRAARRMSITSQVEILNAAARLTFHSDSSLEKMVLLVVKALQEATRAVQAARMPLSVDGSGASAETPAS